MTLYYNINDHNVIAMQFKIYIMVKYDIYVIINIADNGASF
jgi:hypothetical protein